MDKDNLAFVIAACVTVLILFVFMIFFLIKYGTVRECIRVNPNNVEICAQL